MIGKVFLFYMLSQCLATFIAADQDFLSNTGDTSLDFDLTDLENFTLTLYITKITYNHTLVTSDLMFGSLLSDWSRLLRLCDALPNDSTLRLQSPVQNMTGSSSEYFLFVTEGAEKENFSSVIETSTIDEFSNFSDQLERSNVTLETFTNVNQVISSRNFDLIDEFIKNNEVLNSTVESSEDFSSISMEKCENCVKEATQRGITQTDYDAVIGDVLSNDDDFSAATINAITPATMTRIHVSDLEKYKNSHATFKQLEYKRVNPTSAIIRPVETGFFERRNISKVFNADSESILINSSPISRPASTEQSQGNSKFTYQSVDTEETPSSAYFTSYAYTTQSSRVARTSRRLFNVLTSLKAIKLSNKYVRKFNRRLWREGQVQMINASDHKNYLP